MFISYGKKELQEIRNTGTSKNYEPSVAKGVVKCITLLEKYSNLNDFIKERGNSMNVKKLKKGDNVGLLEVYVTGKWRIRFEILNDEHELKVIDLWNEH